MRIRQATMNRFDLANCQCFTIRFTAELISAVRCTASNSQGINPGCSDKCSGLIWVRQQLITRQFARSTRAIFFGSFTGFQRAKYA